MKWKNWNDQLSIVLIILILALLGWRFKVTGELPVEALLVTLTLIVQFYFRRKDETPKT